MSFFSVLGRIVAGKPAFEDRGQMRQPQPGAPETPPSSAIRKGDDSSFPVVYVKRVKTDSNGNNMDVYVQIVNTWPDEVMLDKILVAGKTHEINDFLPGGHEREFHIYSGPRLEKQYLEALLDYKTVHEGDYFQAVHDVTFTYHAADRTYIIDEMHLRRPIRDIYG